MTRTLAPAAVLALALSAAAAPVPKGASAAKPDPLYYAVRVGDKRVTTNPLGRTTTYTVTAVEPQPDGSLWVHEERDAGTFKRTEVLSVSPAGVYRAALVADGKVLKRDRGEYLVRPHRKGGTKWDHSIIPPDRFRQMLARPAPGFRAEGNVLIGPGGRRMALRTHKYEAVGVEKVEVPAGTFEAVRVDQRTEDEANPSDLVVSCWYAPGVGLVKRVLNGRTVAEELQSIEPTRPPVPVMP